MKPTPLTPENEKGIQTNTESFRELETEQDAIQFFSTLKQRLVNVNGWHENACSARAGFQLTEEKGR